MIHLDSEEGFLSGAEIADKLRVVPATVRRWKKEGAPSHHFGNNFVRYKLSELTAWRASRPKTPSK